MLFLDNLRLHPGTQLFLGLLLAWMVATVHFSSLSDSGKIYQKLISEKLPKHESQTNQVITFKQSEMFVLQQQTMDANALSIFIKDKPAFTLRAGSLQALQSTDPMAVTYCSTNLREALVLSWSFSGNVARARTNALKGMARPMLDACKTLTGYTQMPGFGKLAPNSRELVMDLTPGALKSYIGAISQQAVVALGLEVDEALLGTLNEALSNKVASLIPSPDSLATTAFALGGFQFATLCAFVLTLWFALLSCWQMEWAQQATTQCLELVPLTGLAGTLVGMAGAIGALISPDVSNPVERAQIFGPLSSGMALAIETTKYAILLLAVGILVILLRDGMLKSKQDGKRSAT